MHEEDHKDAEYHEDDDEDDEDDEDDNFFAILAKGVCSNSKVGHVFQSPVACLVSMAAGGPVICRTSFEVNSVDLSMKDAMVGQRNGDVRFVCEGSGLVMVVEFFHKATFKNGPVRSVAPALTRELYSPAGFENPLRCQSFRWEEAGWVAPSWQLTPECLPLFVVASYSAPAENLPKLLQMQEIFFQRVREKEQRGSLLYQWNWDVREDGELFVTATELYCDLQGFQEHLEACDDLWPQAGALRTILTIDMHGPPEVMEKCDIYEQMFSPVRLFPTCGPVVRTEDAKLPKVDEMDDFNPDFRMLVV